jgi:cytochrome c-type biogenesis protein CcmH/NrfF
MRNSLIKFLTLFFIFFLNSNISFPLNPESRLEDEKLEQRASKLFLEIRCIVCNGQVIENSNSKFAYDLREYVRSKIKEGKNDEEIKAELISKFGEEILITPSNKSKNILFLSPLIFAIFLAIYFFDKILSLKKLSEIKK